MKKIVFLVMVFLAIVSPTTTGQAGKKYFKAGMDLFDGMKYDDAIAQFTSAIVAEPSNSGYYLARGHVYEQQLKYVDARSDYEKAVVFSPKNVDVLIRLSVVANRTGKYGEALDLLNKASRIDWRNHDVYSEKVIALIGLGRYDQALGCSDSVIVIKPKATDYYYRGVTYTKLKNTPLAKQEFEKAINKDKDLAEPRLALAGLLLDVDPQTAMNQCNEVIARNDRNTDAYLMRSRVFRRNLDFPGAINDISKNIMIEPANATFFLERGSLYQEFNQPSNAISDFTKYITMNPDSANAYFKRARAYEESMSFDKAIQDYNRITVLSEFDMRARKMLKEAQVRLYELNREKAAPEITLLNPFLVKDTVEIKGDITTLLVSGRIKEKSSIKKFTINNENVTTIGKNGEYDFLANVNTSSIGNISITVVDDDDNEKVLNYPIRRTEIAPPVITIVAPYTSDKGIVMLDSPKSKIAIQGKISDESRIRSITVGSNNAQYLSSEMNPAFSATLDVSNLNKFTVVAEDIYGNHIEKEFLIDRTGAEIAANNAMGKTWVIFVENSGYETFASLDGPIKDISTVQRALAEYDIQNVIHKKDMTKKEMEYFFNIELRDQVRSNQVKSLLVWYAGHGKLFNDVSYWIPVDAKRDDEFTYFNINSLKAGLQDYGDGLIHTLVVTDACESGPGFYTATRALGNIPTCDNTMVAGAKSAQVFSSAGYELAVDNSKFTASFASTLMNNKNSCIPIELIVQSVNAAVANDNGQKPKFGRIQGLDDSNGTFFFIAK